MFRMPAVTGELPSRWGLRGVEGLGGGYSAVFTLESGFNVRDGSSGQGGRLFGRQAFVGLKAPYGTLAFGRQCTMTYLALQGAGHYRTGHLRHGFARRLCADRAPDNLVTIEGRTRALRSARATRWPRFGGHRQFAGDGKRLSPGSVAGHPTECRDWSVMLKYDARSTSASRHRTLGAARRCEWTGEFLRRRAAHSALQRRGL